MISLFHNDSNSFVLLLKTLQPTYVCLSTPCYREMHPSTSSQSTSAKMHIIPPSTPVDTVLISTPTSSQNRQLHKLPLKYGAQQFSNTPTTLMYTDSSTMRNKEEQCLYTQQPPSPSSYALFFPIFHPLARRVLTILGVSAAVSGTRTNMNNLWMAYARAS